MSLMLISIEIIRGLTPTILFLIICWSAQSEVWLGGISRKHLKEWLKI
jgi:hypothetical protein